MSTILSVGERIPAFELPDEEGKPFNLPEELEEKLMALFFRRGHWYLNQQHAKPDRDHCGSLATPSPHT
jgi:peroxiredoxin